MIRTFFQLCTFAAKPQDLPASGRLLAACALASFVGHQAGNSVLSASDSTALISLTQTALPAAGLWLLLALYKKPQRWLQSATALLGASALTHLAALPVIVWFFGDAQRVEKFSAGVLSVAAFRIWFLAVTIAIIKETLEIPVGLALAISLALQLLFAIVLLVLFGNQLG